jgi:LemA protein
MRQDFERMLRLAEVEMLGRLGVNAEIELGGPWGTHGRGDFLQAFSIPPTRPGTEHFGDMLCTLISTCFFPCLFLFCRDSFMRRWISLLLLSAALLSLSGCGYNALQASDEQIKASWAEVLNQYQRRADLVPNLVNVVKGYAAHEKDVFVQVTEARAKVGQIQATPELINDPAAFAKFQEAQAQMTSALSRLIAVSENYPQLKADGVFRDLQAQLEGTENRIAVARMRYIEAVQNYNNLVRQFPSNLTAMVVGMKVKPSFTVENEKAISVAPKVDFGGAAPAPAASK